MNKEQIFEAFKKMFPQWAANVVSFKKIGSRCLAIFFNDNTSLVFLYIDENNWQFGTKLWRKRPGNNEDGDVIKDQLRRKKPIKSEEYPTCRCGIDKEV